MTIYFMVTVRLILGAFVHSEKGLLLHIFTLYDFTHMVKDHSNSERKHCHHYVGYSYGLAARDLLCATTHTVQHTMPMLIQSWSTAVTRSRSMGPPCADALLLSCSFTRFLFHPFLVPTSVPRLV